MKSRKEKISSEQAAENKADNLVDVDISDATMEAEDKKSVLAKKRARKEAKKHRTPEEKKRIARKKVLIAGALFAAIVAALLVVPYTRWPVLNTIGFRGDLTVVAMDQNGEKPVGGASVSLENGQTATADAFGKALLRQARLGNQKVVIQKSGYGTIQQTVTNKVGSTQHTVKMKVIGIKLDFDVRHWLTHQKIAGAKVSYKDSTATADDSGVASLIVPPTDNLTIEATVEAQGYLTKKVKTELAIESREVSLVAAPKNYFISKRDGKFDIFSSNLDGSGQKKIIDATGNEEIDLLQFTIHKGNAQAILVANRDGRVENGRIIAGVYIIDLEKATLQKIDEGSEVQLLDWSGDRIVYTKSQANLNYDDPNLSKLMTYHIGTRRLTEITQTNYFSIAVVASEKVFFMPSDPYRPIDNASLTSYNLQTSARSTHLAGKLIHYGARSSYTTLDLQDSLGVNFQINTVNGAVRQIDNRPGASLQFALNHSGSQVAWTDKRDGKGALLLQPSAGGEQKIVTTSPGLTTPLRFIGDDLIVIRSATSEETADYVVSISTGKIAKVVDVSHVGTLRTIGL